MLLATTIMACAFLQPMQQIVKTIPKQVATSTQFVQVSLDRRNAPLLVEARRRAKMLRDNELATENPLDNAILYKKLMTVIKAYESGKISDHVFHVLISEFQVISYTGTISGRLADEWLDEVKLYVK